MSFVASEGRAMLARTPAVLDAWLRGLDDAWLDCDDGPGTWTPRQVLAHLVSGERTDWIPRLRRLLEHGTSVPFDRFDRAASLEGGSRPGDELLDDFRRARHTSLEALDAALASGVDLDSRGMHPDLGEVTLSQLLSTWVAHDLGHILQVSRTMARRYASDVGPWTQYLGVMAGARTNRPDAAAPG
jgi:DinB superfamily